MIPGVFSDLMGGHCMLAITSFFSERGRQLLISTQGDQLKGDRTILKHLSPSHKIGAEKPSIRRQRI
jgi:hypothetical protein